MPFWPWVSPPTALPRSFTIARAFTTANSSMREHHVRLYRRLVCLVMIHVSSSTCTRRLCHISPERFRQVTPAPCRHRASPSGCTHASSAVSVALQCRCASAPAANQPASPCKARLAQRPGQSPNAAASRASPAQGSSLATWTALGTLRARVRPPSSPARSHHHLSSRGSCSV